VNRDDLRVGVSAGIIAATATAGALIAIGSRASTAARPFNVIAGHLLGARTEGVYGFVSSVTVPGVILHVVLTAAMGVAVAYVARRRFMPTWLAATITATLAALVSVGIARRGGSSLARLLAVGDLLVFYVILAASLALGIRFAFSDRATDRRRHEPM
jgi:presenilin-like A22 family membrane protease